MSKWLDNGVARRAYTVAPRLVLAMAIALGSYAPALSAHAQMDRRAWAAYDAGLEALSQNDWAALRDSMTEALQIDSEEGRRPRNSMVRDWYYPTYFIGLAQFPLGNCREATETWAPYAANPPEFFDESPLSTEFQGFRGDCQQQITAFDQQLQATDTAIACWTIDPAFAPPERFFSPQFRAFCQTIQTNG